MSNQISDQKDQKDQKVVNMIFDEETLKALGNFVGINKESSFIWVPEIFRQKVKDKSKWPIFTIKPLDNIDKAKLEDHLGFITYSDGKPLYQPRTGEARLWLIRNNVTSAKNLFNKSTNSFVSFSQENNGLMSEDFVSFLSVELQRELYEAISNSEKLSDEEKVGLL